MVLLNLIQQGPITDFQQSGCGFSVPGGFLERRGDGTPFGFMLNTLHE